MTGIAGERSESSPFRTKISGFDPLRPVSQRQSIWTTAHRKTWTSLGKERARPFSFSGNSSPFNVSSPGHVVTRCFTSNDNSQLQYRSGVSVSGTIDGTNVRDMPYFDQMSLFMAKGTRQIQFITHGSC